MGRRRFRGGPRQAARFRQEGIIARIPGGDAGKRRQDEQDGNRGQRHGSATQSLPVRPFLLSRDPVLSNAQKAANDLVPH